MKIDQAIVPHLWFDANAQEAVDFYVSLFANSKIWQVAHYTEAGPGPEGSVMAIMFTLNGREFAALNAGPQFKFNPSISLLIWCDTQEEIDALYPKLLEGGSEMACGWVTDRFGLSWQVNYAGMKELMVGPKVGAVLTAMGKMKKIDIQKLKDAAR